MIWTFVRTKLWHHGGQNPPLLKLKERYDPLTLESVGQDPQPSKMEAVAGRPALMSLNDTNDKNECNDSKHSLSASSVCAWIHLSSQEPFEERSAFISTLQMKLRLEEVEGLTRGNTGSKRGARDAKWKAQCIQYTVVLKCRSMA